jgi:hypothetical protein
LEAAFAGTVTFMAPAGNVALVTFVKPAEMAAASQAILYVVGLPVAALYDKVDVC